MLTVSHGHWTRWLLRGRPRTTWAVLGGIAPDMAGVAWWLAARARGLRGREAYDVVYHHPVRRTLHVVAHSALAPLALAVAGRRSARARRFAVGWAGHLAADLATHHDDAWPHFWPLSGWRVRSPVSYWQPAHHAALWSRVEVAAIALSALAERRPGPRLLCLVAALAAAVPVIRPELAEHHAERQAQRLAEDEARRRAAAWAAERPAATAPRRRVARPGAAGRPGAPSARRAP